MKRRGAVWVEILLVVAVGGGVLGFLRSLLFPENERRSQCQSQLKQIGLGFMQYTQDYDEKYPPAANRDYGWVEVLEPYLKSKTLFQCPGEEHDAGSDPRQAGYTDYWFNRNVASRQLAVLESPAVTLLSGDGDGGHTTSNSRYAINSLPRAWLNTPDSPALRHRSDNRDGANYAFTDGHVKWMEPEAITTAKISDAVAVTFTFSIN